MLNFPVEKPYDYDLVQAMWVLRRFPGDRLPDVAAEAMLDRFDTPAVLELASLRPPRLEGTDEAVEPAFRAMGRPSKSQSRAAWIVARHLARLVDEYEEHPDLRKEYGKTLLNEARALAAQVDLFRMRGRTSP